MHTRALTQHVKEYARQLRFDLVGVTTPDPPLHLGVFKKWLQAGHHGEMQYLATAASLARRTDPTQILPSCRSILVVGTNYLAAPEPAWPEARIARYAKGEDYHDILVERLRNLVAFIEAEAGSAISYRIYADTGPLLERDLAQRAGLGWIGKNTCLISPRHGSYVLLAEVLLEVALEPDSPFQVDHCGSCTRCIEACPTGCILPDRTLDATRCISYLTIELKGAIPPDLRAQVGDRLFGCDVCQEVCPWNRRFARPTHDPAFAPRELLVQPSLTPFLEWDDDRLRASLRKSPLLRPRLDGLRRNASVVAGNSGSPAFVAPLADLLRSPRSSLVRSHAAWALGRIGGETAGFVLHQALVQETDQAVAAEIGRALCR